MCPLVGAWLVVNAARVILNYALTDCVTGREPSSGVEGGVTRSLKHETLTNPHALVREREDWSG